MIKLTDYKLFDKKGILIEYDTDKEIFFTEEEAEKIKTFLNNRGIENRILKILDVENDTIGEITMKLGTDVGIVRNEVLRLENEGRVSVTNKKRKVQDKDMGLIFVPIYKKN